MPLFVGDLLVLTSSLWVLHENHGVDGGDHHAAHNGGVSGFLVREKLLTKVPEAF